MQHLKNDDPKELCRMCWNAGSTALLNRQSDLLAASYKQTYEPMDTQRADKQSADADGSEVGSTVTVDHFMFG